MPVHQFFLPKFIYPQKFPRLRRDFNEIMYYMMYLVPFVILFTAGGENFKNLKYILSDFTVKTSICKGFYQLKSEKSPAALRKGAHHNMKWILKYIYARTDPRFFEISKKIYIYARIYYI